MMQVKIIEATIFAFLASTCLSAAPSTLRDSGYQNYDCHGSMGPSNTTPTIAHSVRPADIKVIAALGDSLTAGNGAGAVSLGEVVKQYRGLAFSIGGDKGLENHVTIPNILLKYNPGLIGQSHGVGGPNVLATAQLNAAVPGAQASDMPRQAHDLVRRIKNHPHVEQFPLVSLSFVMQDHSLQINAQSDWKLITIFIGGNDICAKCKDSVTQTHSSQNYKKNLRKSIEILHDNLSRLIVSVVGMIQMQILRTIDASEPSCKKHHSFICPCAVLKSFDIGTASQSYQAVQMDLQMNGHFEDRDDFALIVQPFLFNTNAPPLSSNGNVDLGFFAPDCLHFSQFGHSVAAKGLWNNLMQPIGSKSNSINLTDPTFPLLCPDPSCPFIRTTKNSVNCAPYLTPSQ